MGYYANGTGHIEFKEALSEELIWKVLETLEEAFECDRDIEDTQSVYFWNCEKYYTDEVETALLAVADLAPIKEGQIEYIGEDSTIWHFIFKDGGWMEENGYIVYNDVHPDKLEKAIQACAEYLETSAISQSEIRHILMDIGGLSAAELKLLSLERLAEDVA